MTVQELIDELSQIEDKSITVIMSYDGDSGRDNIESVTFDKGDDVAVVNSHC